MKKNKMMRLASFLLIAVLVSTSAISGTYAKYVSEGTAEDSARVAKWGVTVTATGNDSLFAQSYNETGSVTVEAATDVVAPGTEGALVDFTVAGTPEVAVRVKYEAAVDIGDKWMVDITDDGTDNPVFYCPLVVTVGTTVIDGKTKATAADFQTAIKEAIEGVTASYGVGEPIAVNMLDVSWSWPYSTGTDNDKKDTALGDAFNATVSITVDCIVEQID